MAGRVPSSRNLLSKVCSSSLCFCTHSTPAFEIFKMILHVGFVPNYKKVRLILRGTLLHALTAPSFALWKGATQKANSSVTLHLKVVAMFSQSSLLHAKTTHFLHLLFSLVK